MSESFSISYSNAAQRRGEREKCDDNTLSPWNVSILRHLNSMRCPLEIRMHLQWNVVAWRDKVTNLKIKFFGKHVERSIIPVTSPTESECVEM